MYTRFNHCQALSLLQNLSGVRQGKLIGNPITHNAIFKGHDLYNLPKVEVIGLSESFAVLWLSQSLGFPFLV